MKHSINTLLFITFSIVVSSFLLASCSSEFGKEVKIKNSSVYYKNVSEADARRTGDFLYNAGYFNDSNDVSIQISKPKDTLQLRFVVDKDMVKPEFDDQYLFIVSSLSDSIFNKAPIIVFLADTEMKDIKRVGVALSGGDNAGSATGNNVEAILKATEQAAAALGNNVKEVKGNKLYYDNDVEAERVNALAKYLDDEGYFAEGTGHIAVLIKRNNGYVYKEAFTDEQIKSKQTTDALEDVAISIKQEFFKKDDFSFEVCNLNFQKQLSFRPGAK